MLKSFFVSCCAVVICAGSVGFAIETKVDELFKKIHHPASEAALFNMAMEDVDGNVSKKIISKAIDAITLTCSELYVFPESENELTMLLGQPDYKNLPRYAQVIHRIVEHKPELIKEIHPLFVSESHCVALGALMVADGLKMNARPYLKELENLMYIETLPDHARALFRRTAGKTLSQIIASEMMMEQMIGSSIRPDSLLKTPDVVDRAYLDRVLDGLSEPKGTANMMLRISHLVKLDAKPQYVIDGAIKRLQQSCAPYAVLPVLEDDFKALGRDDKVNVVSYYSKVAAKLIEKHPEYLSKIEVLFNEHNMCEHMIVMNMLKNELSILAERYVAEIERFVLMESMPEYLRAGILRRSLKLLEQIGTEDAKAAILRLSKGE